MSTPRVKIYVGSQGEDWGVENLCLDLVVAGEEYPIWVSPELGDCSGDDFMGYLEQAFNKAKLFAKNLQLRVSVDYEQILSQADEYSESLPVHVKKLLKEMKGELVDGNRPDTD